MTYVISLRKQLDFVYDESMLSKKDLAAIESIINTSNQTMKKEIISKLSKKIVHTSDFHDRDHLHTKARVQRIEEVLELPPLPRTK